MLSDLPAQEDLLFLFAESQRTHLRHAVLTNHRASQFSSPLDIVRSTRGDATEEYFLSDAPAHQNGNLTQQVFLAIVMAITFGQLLRHTQGHTARNDSDLVHWICVRHLQSDQGVSCFVIC